MKNFILFFLLSLLIGISSGSFSQTPAIKLVWQQTADVRTIKFSHDATRLVTGGGLNNCYPYECGQIKVWKTADGSLLNTIITANMGLTNSVDISSNNTIISGNGSVYCAGDGGCYPDKPGQFKYNINGTLQKFLNNPGGNIYAIKYSPDETVIAAGTGYNNNGEIRIYDSAYNLLRILPGHQYETDGLAFTPDGKYLISGGDDGLINVWNYKTGTLIKTLVHGDYLNGGAFIDVDVSADGKYFSSAGQGYNMTVKIWRTSDFKLLFTLPVTGGYGYNTARFTPDSKFIFSGTTQYGNLGWHAEIRVWNVSNGSLVKESIDKTGSPLYGGIRSLAFSSISNNKYYLSYSVSDQLKLFSVSSNQALVAEATGKLQPGNLKFTTTAFPNPFTSNTTIQFNLPFKAFVKLSVYNLNGKEVATLLNNEKEAGAYSINFNAAKLSAGVYFYKLQAGEYMQVKKLVISK